MTNAYDDEDVLRVTLLRREWAIVLEAIANVVALGALDRVWREVGNEIATQLRVQDIEEKRF